MLPRAARPRRGHRRAVPRAAAAQNGAAGGGFDYDLVIVGAGVGGHGAALHAFEEDAAFDIKLPRRSLLVEFTCTKCDARTKRLINRAAHDRGTVFLQCARCQVYHKFVDNLGLIVEYDLREENEVNACTED